MAHKAIISFLARQHYQLQNSQSHSCSFGMILYKQRIMDSLESAMVNLLSAIKTSMK